MHILNVLLEPGSIAANIKSHLEVVQNDEFKQNGKSDLFSELDDVIFTLDELTDNEGHDNEI